MAYKGAATSDMRVDSATDWFEGAAEAGHKQTIAELVRHHKGGNPKGLIDLRAAQRLNAKLLALLREDPRRHDAWQVERWQAEYQDTRKLIEREQRLGGSMEQLRQAAPNTIVTSASSTAVNRSQNVHQWLERMPAFINA